MVCIYCGNDTRVTNSRLQRRSNTVWRRRLCAKCGAVFTSLERVAYDQSLGVVDGTSHIMPFTRDILYLSIYESCRHRETAIVDATALTDTILGKLVPDKVTDGLLRRTDLVRVATDTLRRFDRAALVHYQAFHPLTKRARSAGA